jgi:hypothetical protein
MDESKDRVFVPNPVVLSLVSKITIGKTSRHGKGVAVSLAGTYPVLCEILRNYCLISDWIVGTTIQTGEMTLPTLAMLVIPLLSPGFKNTKISTSASRFLLLPKPLGRGTNSQSETGQKRVRGEHR